MFARWPGRGSLLISYVSVAAMAQFVREGHADVHEVRSRKGPGIVVVPPQLNPELNGTTSIDVGSGFCGGKLVGGVETSCGGVSRWKAGGGAGTQWATHHKLCSRNREQHEKVKRNCHSRGAQEKKRRNDWTQEI